ncbi:MAG: Ig-like domain-containing protein [Pseudomonadota bacterium]
MPIIGNISEDGNLVTLDLTLVKEPRVGNVAVERRLLGESGAESWRPLAPELGSVLGYQDGTTEPGKAYEYKVTRSAKDIVDVGYFATGRDIPAVERRGKALLIVDETLIQPLKSRLSRFARDLTGDGWEVVFQRAPRDNGKDIRITLERADGIRNWIKTQYQDDPFDTYATILVGGLPYVMSGRVGPDGHGKRPHATDLFYADIDGQWGVARDAEGKIFVVNERVPSDWIEMQIGRIDFSQKDAAPSDDEVHILRAYFDKNHHWRNAFLGDLRQGYGKRKHLVVERDGLLNVLGPDNISEGGHHDIGEEQPWLWGAAFGSNKLTQYRTKFRNKAVFVINFGSHKQQIAKPKNTLRASLAQPWYTVAAGWGARPAWRLHHMALGGTIGEAHMRTVNNGRAAEPYRESMDYFPTGRYLWRNPIWVNLLGDPTLRAFMLAPPQAPVATIDGDTVQLSWAPSPDPDTRGYRVFRASDGGPFERIAELGADARGYLDAEVPANTRYMIRALGLKQVAAGSFYTLSQGAFAVPGAAQMEAGDVAVQGQAPAPIPLPLRATDPETGQMQAPIEPPAFGTLSLVDGRWFYTPADGFAGTDQIRYTQSTDAHTDAGTITITVDAAAPDPGQ